MNTPVFSLYVVTAYDYGVEVARRKVYAESIDRALAGSGLLGPIFRRKFEVVIHPLPSMVWSAQRPHND